MNDKVEIPHVPTGTMVPNFDRQSMPDVQCDYWPNPDFDLEEVIRARPLDEPVPLTAVIGPHSIRIAATLANHETLNAFRGGVDERAVYSFDDPPLGFGEYVDWDQRLNDRPFVFGYFDEYLDCYEAFCLNIRDDWEYGEHLFRIDVAAIVEFDAEGSKDLFEFFCDPVEPLRMKYVPGNATLETDILRLRELDLHDLTDFLGQLCYVAAVLSDGRTQADPFAGCR